jgi:hypothetical protein
MPVPGFTPQMMVTAGDATLFKRVPPPSSVAPGVLKQYIAGKPGLMVYFGPVHSRPAKIITDAE